MIKEVGRRDIDNYEGYGVIGFKNIGLIWTDKPWKGYPEI